MLISVMKLHQVLPVAGKLPYSQALGTLEPLGQVFVVGLQAQV